MKSASFWQKPLKMNRDLRQMTKTSFGVVSIHLTMQNRYTADVGDFGKFALLNALSGDDLKLA
jgi:hypothetical protein